LISLQLILENLAMLYTRTGNVHRLVKYPAGLVFATLATPGEIHKWQYL